MFIIDKNTILQKLLFVALSVRLNIIQQYFLVNKPLQATLNLLRREIFPLYFRIKNI